ncbi:MAG TPA: C1 family peptidase [Solirubrobacteraceae bacterium]
MALELAQLRQEIARLDLGWHAAETANSGHSDFEARNRLGYVPGPEDPSLDEAEQQAAAMAPQLAEEVAGAPASFDWRNAGGNYVTPVVSQGGCGSCVAFGSIAAMESLVMISRRSTAPVDLSEADLWFCWGPGHGAGKCPGGGWWPNAAYDGMQAGVVDAACFPYTDADQGCSRCGDWQNRITKISGWKTLTTAADMKTHLSTVGPVTACFTVYEDFYYHYAGGVYTYNAGTAGKVIGGHCICIVGYDDAQGCWIAKNSWGTGWGESGYFRMAYGSCGIDNSMWAATGIVQDRPTGGRLEVFARGSDKALWHIWQTAPSNGWSGWASMGGIIDQPVIARNADGRLEVFVIGADHALWHIWQTAPNNGWSGWASMGGWIDELAVGQNADGRLEIFARGSDKALWHIWQTRPSNGWSGWASMGGVIDQPVTARNADGRLEIFVIGGDHALWHIWQTAPSNGWSGWASLGGWVDRPVVANNADGRLEIMVIGSDHALWHMWQTAPSNGWSGWASMGGWIDELAIGQNAAAGVAGAAGGGGDGAAGMPVPQMVAAVGGGGGSAMPDPAMTDTPAGGEMPIPSSGASDAGGAGMPVPGMDAA